MTIGIAVCLSDGALLIADGLTVLPFRENRILSIDARKITRIGSTLAAISFGVIQGTEYALSVMNRSAFEIATSVADIETEIERCTSAGWTYLLSNLGLDVDPTHENMRVGFLVGGYIRISPLGGLILGTLYKHGEHDAPFVRTSDNIRLHHSVVGGEEQDAKTLFKNYAQQEYDRLISEGSGVRNNIVNAYITAGVRTINEVSELDPRIGGTIRYTIIRRGFPITEGICGG